MYRCPRVWPRLRACECSTCRSDDWWTLLRGNASTQKVCSGWRDVVCRLGGCQRKRMSSRHLCSKLSRAPSFLSSSFFPSFFPSPLSPSSNIWSEASFSARDEGYCGNALLGFWGNESEGNSTSLHRTCLSSFSSRACAYRETRVVKWRTRTKTFISHKSHGVMNLKYNNNNGFPWKHSNDLISAYKDTLCQCTLHVLTRNKSLGFVIIAALALWPYMSCDLLCLCLMHLLRTKCVSSSVPLQAVRRHCSLGIVQSLTQDSFGLSLDIFFLRS